MDLAEKIVILRRSGLSRDAIGLLLDVTAEQLEEQVDDPGAPDPAPSVGGGGGGGAPPLVTELPGSPTADDEVYYAADAAGDYGGPYLWHLRYRPDSPHAYKWDVLSAEDLYAEVLPYEVKAAGNQWGDLSAFPSIALPLAGDWKFKHGVMIYANAGADSYASAGLRFGATAPNDNDILILAKNGAYVVGSNEYPKLGLAAGTVVKQQYKAEGADCRFQNRRVF